MADFVATIHVQDGQSVWRAAEVPHLTADSLYRFEPEPDPLVPRAELRRVTNAEWRQGLAGKALTVRELACLNRACRAAGLSSLPDELRYSQWGVHLEACNHEADARGWLVCAMPPRDSHRAERFSWAIAADEHRKLLQSLLSSGDIQARMAGTLVPAPPGLIALDHLVLTREALEQFAARLAMRVTVAPPNFEPNIEPEASAPEQGRRVKLPQAFAAQEAEVLRTLRQLGHDPKRLPPQQRGKPWVKSDAWRAIGACQLFASETVFKKAWERLRNTSEIAERRGL